jgi:hypothetical protein
MILLIEVNLTSDALQVPRSIITVRGDGKAYLWVSNFSMATYQIYTGETIANAVLASSQVLSIHQDRKSTTAEKTGSKRTTSAEDDVDVELGLNTCVRRQWEPDSTTRANTTATADTIG